MGELRPKPGIYHNFTWDEYLRIPYLNPSTLKHGLRSGKRLKRKIDGDIPQPSEKTTAVGSAVHYLVAGEHERVAVMPSFENDEKNLTKGTIKTPPEKMFKANDELSQAGKKWILLCEEHGKPENYQGEIAVGQRQTDSKLTSFYQSSVESFRAKHDGQTILTEVQDATAKKVARNIRDNRDCQSFITDCDHEVTVIAEVEGVMVKTRIDLLNQRDSSAGDIKATYDIEPKAFYRTCKQFNYLFQFGCHMLFLANAGNQAFQLQSYDVIAAEIGDDYDVGLIHILPFDLLDTWADRAREVIKAYSLANATGNWLGLYPSAAPIYVPNWDMSDDSEVEFKG